MMEQTQNTRGSTGLVVVLILAVIVIIGGLLFSTGTENETPPNAGEALALKTLPRTITVLLEPTTSSTQRGKVKIRAFREETAVTVGVIDFVSGTTLAAAIYEGTCTTPGSKVYDLQELSQEAVKDSPQGFSDTTLHISLVDFLAQTPFAITIFGLADENNETRPAACGTLYAPEITPPADGLAATATSSAANTPEGSAPTSFLESD